MKKILLATTVLAMSAGYAAADITWGASAAAGIASNGTANGGVADPNAYGKGDGEMLTYSNANLAVTLSGTSDSGLTYGASFDATMGVSYALADDDGFDTNGGAFGAPSIFIEGAFGKLTLNTDGLDGFDGDELADGDYDAEYAGTFGGFTVGAQADLDSGQLGVKGGYTMGALALSASYSQQPTGTDDIWNLSATYTMGSIAITAATDNAEDSSIKVAYSANGISASAKVTNDSADGVDLAAGYSANGLAVNASTNTEDNNWEVTASYDLGGGLSVEAGTNYTEDLMIGAKMSF